MKLAYFGTPVSPNQVVSKQGYLLCLNVPICRTGDQEYLGSELEGHPGYDSAWGLNPNERYKVYRPIEEVTDPATVASFEGVTVVDEHPNAMMYPGSLVTVENDKELNRGHAQNIRTGTAEQLDCGETPLIADLHVKSMELIDKIDNGIREVSCGYTFVLKRRPDGTLVMTRIRGNHVAVVPNGRAGSEIAIGDAQPTPQLEVKEKTPVKNLRNRLIGLGLMAAAAAKDADPEELAAMAKEATKDEETPEEKPAEKEAVKDSEEKPEEKAEEKPAVDAEELEDEKKPEVISDSDEDLELSKQELGKHALKGALDSSRALIKTLKPWVGSGQAPRAVVDRYNEAVRALNNTNQHNPYAGFVQMQAPILAVDSAKTTINPRDFFAGKTYAEGMAAYKAATMKQGGN